MDAFRRARSSSRPPASAEVLSVYWAVLCRDSRMRRAIFSRMVEIAVSGACKSELRIIPPIPEPWPAIPIPPWILLPARAETLGAEW